MKSKVNGMGVHGLPTIERHKEREREKVWSQIKI